MDILDANRRELIPLFEGIFDDGFYLAGGTGLALQLGHRDSIDFDFFIENDFDTDELFKKLTAIFVGHSLLKTYEEKNTLYVIIDSLIKVSFITYPYQLKFDLTQDENLSIASILDIGAMKLSAIISRSLEKDYVDLYFILQKYSLKDIINTFKYKYIQTDALLALKALSYFGDVESEEIIYKRNNDIDFEIVKTFLVKIVVDEKF